MLLFRLHFFCLKKKNLCFLLRIIEKLEIIMKSRLRVFLLLQILSFSKGATPGPISPADTELNPLLQPSHIPLFETIDESHFERALKYVVSNLLLELKILENVPPSWISFALPLKNCILNFKAIISHINFLYQVKYFNHYGNFHKHYDKATHTFIKALQKPIYLKKLDAIAHKHDLTDIQKKVLKQIQYFLQKTGGHLEEGPQRELFGKYKKIRNLKNIFSDNLDIISQKSFVLAKSEDVWFFNSAYTGSDTPVMSFDISKEGKVKVPLTPEIFTFIMSHSPNNHFRRDYFKAYMKLGCQEPHNNLAVAENILDLRLDVARLLGYDSFAELALQENALREVEQVESFFDKSWSNMKNEANEKFLKLTELAKTRSSDSRGNKIQTGKYLVDASNLQFWSKVLFEEEKDFNVFDYLTLPRVLGEMFNLANKLYRIQILEEDPPPGTRWHPDVRFYKVYDQTGAKEFGAFFMDIWADPERKVSQSWTIAHEVRNFMDSSSPSGSPVATIAMSIKKDPHERLELRDVMSLFHEFGHVLHALFFKNTRDSFLNYTSIERDAAEIPATFMEMWVLDERIFMPMASHYLTHEGLTEQQFSYLKKVAEYDHFFNYELKHFVSGMLDFYLHSQKQNRPLKAMLNEFSKLMGPIVPGGESLYPNFIWPPLASFRHVFGGYGMGQYAASYYSYAWSRWVAKDLYGAFRDVKTYGAMMKLGNSFRKTLLEPNQWLDPLKSLHDFLGKPILENTPPKQDPGADWLARVRSKIQNFVSGSSP